MAEDEVQFSYEYWDCSCGNKGLRGDIEVCPGCGHPRDADVTFYRREGKAETIADAKELERFKSGPDWVCSFCQELNFSLAKECRSCGHMRFESDQNYFQNQLAKEHKNASKSEPSAPKINDTHHGMFVILGLLLVVAIGCWWCTRINVVDYVVTSVWWKRSVPVERYEWVQRENWRSEVQGDGVVELSSRRQVRSYEQRQVGTRLEHYTEEEQYQSGTRDEESSDYQSLGNGAGRTVTTHHAVPVYSTRELDRTGTVPVLVEFPIYDTKVSYRAKVYHCVQTLWASSTDNRPNWPQSKLEKGVDNKPDREGARTESYNVVMTKSNAKEKGPPERRLGTTEQLFEHKYLLGNHIQCLVNNMGIIKGEVAEH